MTGQDIMDAFEKWKASLPHLEKELAGRKDPFEEWLRIAFAAGFDAAHEADKQNMKELGVLWP